jgi:predicted DNA-binding transcriptional regulator AlpA
MVDYRRGPLKTFLRKRQVAERYNVTTRTIERWSEDGRLPPPIFRGIVPLWDQAELDAQDHAAAAVARASGKLKTTAADTKEVTAA